MRDRQYCSSVVISAAAAIATLIGIVFLLLWLRWAGLIGLSMSAGGLLAWFYWGPRPDLKPKSRGDQFNEAGNE